MQTRLSSLFVCIAASSNNLVAADEPDFRTQWAIPSVWLFESPQIRQKLERTGQQSEQIDALINDWKAIVLKARKDHETNSHSPGLKTRTGRNRIPITSVRNAIREHLTAEQLPTFDFTKPVRGTRRTRILQDLGKNMGSRRLKVRLEYRSAAGSVHAANRIPCERGVAVNLVESGWQGLRSTVLSDSSSHK